jgi:hypothetical protein
MPTHVADHISCAEDVDMGHRVKFTVHRDLDWDEKDHNKCR